MSAVRLAYGGPPLLDGAGLVIERGERLCLLGRNGTGKSTLLGLLAGTLEPDTGEIARPPGLRVALLPQETPAGTEGTVFEVVAAGLGAARELLTRHHRVSGRVARGEGAAALAELEGIQRELEAHGGWHLHGRVETVLSRLGLEAGAEFGTLSGGIRRRVLLARALVAGPDLLLLDEPTNHLDIDAIAWLEGFLPEAAAALLFVTHDRMFLQHLATRIVELDRGRLTSWPGDYEAYLRRREQRLAAEAGQQAQADRRLAQEEAWVRGGLRARRRRDMGRVRALEKLREARRARRAGPGRARLRAQQARASGRLVLEAEALGYRIGGRELLGGLDLTLLRGDRVGLIGPNGSGKTTLLRLLLGEIPPAHGRVRHGTRLEVAYFDQHRVQLDEQASLRDNVSPGSDTVTVDGRPRHVISYLQDFLFPPARARSPVSSLSGGERNRLLLARLFSRPSNVLVLDEPTNDLDLETLELLEALLLDYAGSVLLVTHDRALLDHVVTSTLVFEGAGRVREYVGGYSDWLRQAAAPPPAQPRAATARAARGRRRRRKLGYREQQELAALPQRIEALEQEQQALQARLADPAFYRAGGAAVRSAGERLGSVERELRAAYARWESLEKQEGG